MDVQTIIENAGGVGKLATLLGVQHPTVSGWKADGAIPASRLMQISGLLNLSIDEIKHLASPPRSKAQ